MAQLASHLDREWSEFSEGDDMTEQFTSNLSISSELSPVRPLSACTDDIETAFTDPTDFPGEEEEFDEDADSMMGRDDMMDDDGKDDRQLAPLPPHACAYCGTHDAQSVVRCGVPNCGKWFCNGRGNTSAAHILHHMIRSKHKEISLHPNGLLGAETVLECFVCGGRNVFVLGFVSSKTDAVVILLCRDPCVNIGMRDGGDGGEWDASTWLPLIEDRQLLPWLVKPPPFGAMGPKPSGHRVTPITTQQIIKLEDMWKVNPRATVEDLLRQERQGMIRGLGGLLISSSADAQADQTQEIKPVGFFYDDAYAYESTFIPLLDLEAKTDEEMKKQHVLRDANITWTAGLSGRWLGQFDFPRVDGDSHVVVGDEIKIIHCDDIEKPQICEECDGIIDGDDNRCNCVKNNVTSRKNIRDIEHGVLGTVIRLNLSASGTEDEVIVEVRLKTPQTSSSGAAKGTKKVSSTNATMAAILNGGTAGYNCELVWKSVSFDRMRNALKIFARDETSLSPYLYHRLLGHAVDTSVGSHGPAGDAQSNAHVPLELSTPGSLPRLNHSQASAVRGVLSNSLSSTKPISLIQGPPGTGKTVTSATLVYHLVQIHNNIQVLVTAPSNVAVDHLTECIAATGLRVVRICAKSRENMQDSSVGVSGSGQVEPFTLHYQVEMLAKKVAAASPTKDEAEAEKKEEKAGSAPLTGKPKDFSKKHAKIPHARRIHISHQEAKTFIKLRKLQEECGALSSLDERKYHSLLRKMEYQILASADVICATCVSAGDSRLLPFRLKHVLIDESTQACEPETLIPLVHGAKQLVLVGDHCQLGPVILCKQAVTAGLGRSLFERLVLLGVRPHRLQIQYRMHPAISAFPSDCFYEGTLANGVTNTERLREEHLFVWPNPSRPVLFYDNTSQEELSGSGTSYLNRKEAAVIALFVNKLLALGVLPSEMGVITPYEGQRGYIVNYLVRNGTLPSDVYKAVEVSSVDAFQGREKPYILLSCVRSNNHQGIGFLSDARRLNVALTRAQSGLIIVGNGRVLSRHPLWNKLLVHYKQYGLVVSGPVDRLKVIDLQLQRPAEPKSTLFRTNVLGQEKVSSEHEEESQAPRAYPPFATGAESSSSSYNYIAGASKRQEAEEKQLEVDMNDDKYSRMIGGIAQLVAPSMYQPGSTQAVIDQFERENAFLHGGRSSQSEALSYEDAMSIKMPYHPGMTPVAQTQSYAKALCTHLMHKQRQRKAEAAERSAH
ncbi:mRNA decay factorlike protein [Perkinsela sp. CCAP 1560/4]|nr:mRNA decay factorlike protein [Perkinsela sp. CCAP 1560/4]|eukprot:KNH07326.1 mRNA decay factorlike protein [Perkinsela sp. CCAP 1560/4]